MADSLLQREFKERDIQRIRNIVKEKYGEKTVTQVGYEKTQHFHNEGDIWEENGKTWTIKNGIKKTFSKLQMLKKTLLFPIFCPCCKKPMRDKLDKKMFSIHHKCFSCVLSMETELKAKGQYQEYVNDILTGNYQSFISEAKNFIIEFANESDDIYYTEDGEKQDFTDNKFARKQMIQTWIKELEEIENTLKQKLDEKSDQRVD